MDNRSAKMRQAEMRRQAEEKAKPGEAEEHKELCVIKRKKAASKIDRRTKK